MATRSSIAMLALSVTAALVTTSALAAQTKAAAAADPPASATPVDADNSTINKRDRNDTAILPTDQPNNSADLKVAADVRSAIVKDDSLSMKAHNIKLVATGGLVVLRGPVQSAEEKARVEKIAVSVAGVTRVENLLEVSAP